MEKGVHASVSPAAGKGDFSQLLPSLRTPQSSSSVPSAPSSRCTSHFGLSDPLAAPPASRLRCCSPKPPQPQPRRGGTNVYRANRIPQDLRHGTTAFALYIICSKSWSPSAFLNQIISDVPPSPGQRFRDANLTSSTACSLANYQPAAAFSAGAPGGIKRRHLQLLPTHTSHILAGWRRFRKQARWAEAAQIVLTLIPPKENH